MPHFENKENNNNCHLHSLTLLGYTKANGK